MNLKKMVLAAVAMVFAFSAHSGELVKKKDSFAEGAPPGFLMAHAKEKEPCYQNGDIGMSTDGSVLSCQSWVWKKSYTPGRFQTTVNEPNNSAGSDGYAVCGASPDKQPGMLNWIITCGQRACSARGYSGGIVQEHSCKDLWCPALLTCF